MKKVVKLTESDLNRLIRRVINENKIDSIIQSDDFLELVDILKSNPIEAEELRNELSESLNEDSDEYDYHDYVDEQPRKIGKKQYWIRRLKGLGLGAAVGALLGAAMAGGFSAEDVLQMALASAAGAGAVSDTLVRTVGRTKKIDNVEENFLRKKNTRVLEIDVNRLVSKILNEDKKSKSEYKKFEKMIDIFFKDLEDDIEGTFLKELMKLKKEISKNDNLSKENKKELATFINLRGLHVLTKGENN